MLAWLLTLWFQSALAQNQWRLVYQDGSVESVWGIPQPGSEKLVRLQYAWVWSEIRAPRRVEAKDLGKHSSPVISTRLEIRIVPPQGARPPAGARVIAAPLAMWLDLPEDLLPSWPVPAGGRLTIPHDPGKQWRLRVSAPKEGSWWADVPPGQKTALLAPAPARGLRTQVTDAEGAPLGPVNGSILEGRGRQGGNRFWAGLRGETGRLELPGLPDLEEITFTVTKPGYTPTLWRGRPSELPDRLQLGTGATLTGRTADAGGKPVAGATIQVESWASPQVAQLYRMRARSKEDGSWTLAGVLPGAVFLSVRAPGFAPFGQQMDALRGKTDLGTMILTPGRTVAVLAVDDQGQPVAGAQIEAGPGISAESNDKGIARLAGVSPVAPLKLTAWAARHLPGKAQVNPPFPEQVQIDLPRSFTILGRFLEAPDTPAASGLVRTEQASCQKEHRVDDGGRFELDLPPGEAITVVLRSARTQELRLPLAEGTAGESRDLGDLLPPAGLAILGRVVRAGDGVPVAAARVWTPRPGAGGAIFSWAGRDLLETATGEDGRFRLTGLAPGPALLRVEAAGFARAHLNLSLAGADTPVGAVDVGNVPLAAGATLRVLVASPVSPPDSALARADLRGGWSEVDMLTAPVADGVATLRNVPPGKVTVSVLAGRKLLCEREMEIPAAADLLDVDCAQAALRVAGVVLVGGAPAGPGRLSWQPPATTTASRIDNVVSPGGLRQQTIFGEGRPSVDVPVEPDGKFLTEDLTPGRWQVSWIPEAGVISGSQTVDIPEAEHFETAISYPGLAVSGRVVDEKGRPAEGARVRELTSGALAFVAADGSFTLAGLGGRKAVIQAQHDELSSPVLQLELEPDRLREPVLLTLGHRATARIDVRVVDAAGSPVSGAFVFLEEEGKGLRILTAGADGTATTSFEPPLPARVRAAATVGSAWALGNWLSWEQAQEGFILKLADRGGLLIESRQGQGSPRLLSENGWDLSWLLRLLGSPPSLSPEQPLRLEGLPAGLYTLSLNGKSLTVMVTGTELAKAGLN